MQNPFIFRALPSGGHEQVSSENALALCDGVSSLTAPGGFSRGAVDSLAIRFKDWFVTGTASGKGEGTVGVADFFASLHHESLLEDFRANLACLSSSPGINQVVPPPFGLSGFCELRVGLAALELEPVSHVEISEQNSFSDKQKTDLTVHEHPGESTPFQVKARAGRKGREDSRIPTIRHVLRRDFSDVQTEIEVALAERKG